MRNTVIQELERLAETDSRLSIITADLGFSVLESFAQHYPDRFFNVGISEQLMASAAAGMALCDKVVFTYSIGNFATLRCIEQIRNDICYHNVNVKIIAVGAGIAYGQLGMSHHATEDIAMMRALPHMKVLVPADPEEALAAVRYAVATDGPCYIRLAKRGEPVLYPKQSDIRITKIQPVVEGRDVALLLCGPLLKEGILAAKLLGKRNISAGVFSVPCIKPLDEETIQGLAGNYPLLITVEEHQSIGGLGGAVAEVVSEIAASCTKLKRIGLQDEYTSTVGSREYLCNEYGLSGSKIADAVLKFLE